MDNSTPDVFDVEVLLDKCGEVLRREIQMLLMETAKMQKLSAASARDLVNYTKLLAEIRKSQLEDLKQLTDEQLQDLAKKE